MLYTERHGIRAPINKTYCISIEMYNLLFDCCQKYKKNLTHIFTLNCHHDFTDSDYIAFNENGFINRIKIKIPALYKDEYGRICAPSSDDDYDQYALLDYIEFFAQNMKDISERWNNERYRNFQTIECLNTINVLKTFQNEINDILIESGLLYTLTDDKIIERIVENSPLTQEIENQIVDLKEHNLQDLLDEAISLYKSPYPNANKLAVEKIWDALENLKVYFVDSKKKQADQKVSDILSAQNEQVARIFEKELSELGNIGNNYHIRHYNDNQVVVTDNRHYDYFFNRCLSLIGLAIQYL